MPVNSNYINTERTGDVWVEDFDRGVIETLGGRIIGDDYFVHIPDVKKGFFSHDYRVTSLRETEMPDIMVIFAAPDDRVQAYSLPCIVVRRDALDPAEDRWPSKNIKYQAPAPGASQSTIDYHGTSVTGWSSYEEQEGAWPYDFTYMISVLAGGRRCTTDAQRMLKHVLRVWQPKANNGVFVTDSIGGTRSYEAFSDGPIDLKEALDIVDRQAGFSINLRINGEIDLNDPYFTTSVTSLELNSDVL
jgi:hypothetical protein